MCKGNIRSTNNVLAITTISHLVEHLYVGVSILLPFIMVDLNLKYSELGIVIAVSSLIGGLSQIIFSIISRKIPRHVLLGLGNIMLSFGAFLTGLSYNIVHFLNAKIVTSLGIAPQHTMGTAIIAERFDSESFGKAIGIHYGLAYIGNIIGPLFMTYLVVVMGWRNALLIFSIPALIVGLTIIWYLKGETKAIRSDSTRNAASLKSDLIAVLKTKNVTRIIITQALIAGIGLPIIASYLPLFLADSLRLDVYARGLIYTIGLIGGVIGTVLLGKYADKFGYLRTAACSICIALISTYLLTLYKSSNLLLALHLFLLCFSSFASSTLLQSYLAKITREYERDLALGLFFTALFVFSSLWSGIIGYVIDRYASFDPALILMGTLGLIGLGVLVVRLGFE